MNLRLVAMRSSVIRPFVCHFSVVRILSLSGSSRAAGVALRADSLLFQFQIQADMIINQSRSREWTGGLTSNPRGRK